MCVHRLFMLLVRLMVDSRLLVVKFAGNQKCADFQQHGGSVLWTSSLSKGHLYPYLSIDWKGALGSPTVRSLEKETETVRLVMDWRNQEKSDSTKELVKFENLGVSPQAYRINIPGWGQAYICTKKPSS